MRRFAFACITLALSLCVATSVILNNGRAAVQQPESHASVIPFDFINRHIVVHGKINNSPPLSFLFDTGDKYGIVALSRAQQLGLSLSGEIQVGGAGSGLLKGAYVKDASLVLAGLDGAPLAISMALPLNNLELRFGQNIDGIIGGDFIKKYIVEVDYDNHVLRLYDRSGFAYSGKGEIVPFQFSKGGHPMIRADVELPDAGVVPATFIVDLGAGGALSLYSPFVAKYHLPVSSQKTIAVIGSGGTGGAITGRLGRIGSLKIGRFNIRNPVTLFSTDKQGVFATTEMQGNLGTEIFQKFKVFLDYEGKRIILEPGATFDEPVGRPSAGISVLAEGKDFKSFRVDEILPDAPAAEAGVQKDDVILAVNGADAANLTLPDLMLIFERQTPANVSVRRGDKLIKTVIKPRLLV